MITVTTTDLNNIVYVEGSGKITGKDYESVLIPKVEAKFKEYRQVHVLYHLGKDFLSFEPKALWDDAKIGFMHWKQWEKIALVSDVEWIVKMTKFFRFLIPFPFQIFSNDDLPLAYKWIQEIS